MDQKTKISNESGSDMMFESRDQFFGREAKRIKPGEHINISSWEGFELSKLGILLTYYAYPTDRTRTSDYCETFLPDHVRRSSEIKISCDVETGGVHLTCVPANGDFKRISIVRFVMDLFCNR